MEFASAAHQECYEKVKKWMTELFGEMAASREDWPGFTLSMGSAWMQVSVYGWGDKDASIAARSWVVRKVELVPELLEYLLRENDGMRFGAFGLDADKDIFFEHTIMGSTATKAELKATVMAVITTADRYDDQIVSRWGGQRGLD